MDNNVLVSSYMSCGGSEDEAAEAQSYIDTLGQAVIDGTLTLVNLVTLLGDYLTRENDVVRARATNCLAEVLAKLPQTQLNKRQVNVVTRFFSDRLEDEPCVPELLRGLQSVVQMQHFVQDEELQVVVLKALRDQINMRRIVQQVRYVVYTILEKMAEDPQHGSESDFFAEFTDSFLTLSAGEKDPRNLLISFKLSNLILTTFPTRIVEKEQEKLFDNVFCYFPITFQQPKNDPYGITANQLKEALDGCLAANGIFAKQVFPALIEKLTAVSQQVKIDAMNAMCVCLEQYDPKIIADKEVWQTLWDGLKFEVLHGSEEVDTAVLAATVLRQLASSLSKSESNHSESEKPLDTYLEAIKSETMSKLEQSPVKSTLPAAMLVAGISYASPAVFKVLVSFGMEFLMRQLDATIPAETLQWGLEVQVRYLSAYSKLAKDYPSKPVEFPQWERVFQVLLKCLAGVGKSEHQVRTLALNGLIALCEQDIVSKEEIEYIVQYFDDIILSTDVDDEPLRGKSLECLLRLVSSKKEDAIVNVTYPALLANLGEDSKHAPKYILSALSTIASTRTLFETLSVRLFSRLDELAQSPADLVKTNVVAYYMIDALYKSASQLNPSELPLLCPRLTENLMSRVVSLDILHADATVDISGKLLNMVMISLHEYEHKALFLQAYECIKSQLEPFRFSVESNLVALYEAGVACVDETSQIDGKDIVSQSFSQLQKKGVNSYIRGAHCRLVALASNKWVPDQDIIFLENIVNQALEHEPTAEALEAICWCAKGLVLKAHPLGFKLAAKIVEMAVDPTMPLSSQAALLSAVLVIPDPMLSLENGAKIRKLHVQRLVSENLPKLVDGFHRSDSRVNSLVTLSGILRYVPSKILIPEIPKILPLLVESFEMKNAVVQEAAINTILVTLADASDMFGPYVSTLVPRLLRMARYSKTAGSPAVVRSAALSCLCSMASCVPRQSLEPFRPQIIKELGFIVDDPKRQVRKQAVICGQVYHELR